ncbi:MAG: hypothetical protein EAZ92_13275 [Candidatus Kapaibacterium sp.]|nr:MAG: hypothetical protein EAZ92_13275 [Candidatus Kapabacteria bacterium]
MHEQDPIPPTPDESSLGEQMLGEQTPPAPEKREQRRGFFFWFRRTVLALMLLGMVFGATVTVFISVPTLRQWLVKTVISTVNARLEAKVEFDDFSGSLISDLNLSGLRMIAAGDTILQARELQLHYDVELLLVRKIMLNGVKLVEPRITLLRSMDSSWNFTHLFPPPDSTKKLKPFRWRVEVRDFAIEQGSVRVFDSLAAPTPRLPAFLLAPEIASALQRAGLAKMPAHRFNPTRANFDSVNLSLAAMFNPRTKEGTASLYHLSFRETASNLRVRNIAFAAQCDTNRAELKYFRCQTSESLVRMRLVADNINIFRRLDSAQIHALHLQAALHADSISLRDVQRFTSALDDFAGKLALRFDAYGSLPRMTLKTLSLATVPDANRAKASQTLLSLEGNFTNTAWNLLSWNDSLHKPNALKPAHILAKTAMDVVINPMRISYADLCRFAPGLIAKGKIPNLSGVNFLAIEQGTVRGTMENLEAKLALKSGAGAATLDARFHAPSDARRDTARYEANIAVSGVDVGAIANNPSLKSSLNATITLKGQGLTLKDANTALQLEASNSEIAGRSFDQLSLDATLRDAGILTLNNAHLHWNRPADFVLDDDTDENIPRNADLWLSGLVNVQNMEKPTYRIESRAAHLDLYRLTLFPGSNTDASFTMNVLGSSFNPDSLQGIFTLRATDFRTPKKAFEPFSISARLEHLPTPQNPLYREFHLQSELAEAHVRGTFTMPSFVSSFANEVDNTIFAVRRKYHLVRDSILASTYEGLYIKKPAIAKPLDAEFSLLPRDIEISRLFSGFVKIQCKGEMHGSIRGTTQDYTFTVDSSHIREFYYTDDGTSVEIANAGLQGTFHHASSGDSLNVIAAKASVRMDSLFRVNDFIFRHAKGSANYTGETFDFDVRGLYSSVGSARADDSTLAFYTKALLDMRRRDTEFTLDTAWLLYRNDMEWATQGKMTSILNKEGLLIEQLALKRPRGETAYLSGQVWFDHFSNAQLILESMPLQDINRLFTKENRIPTLAPLKGTLERLQITLSGIPAEPRMNILLNASNVLYNNTFLGTLQLEATHSDSTVRGTAEVLNPRLLSDKPLHISLDSLKTLRVTAKTFPLNLAFTDVEERIVSGKPIDISFDANELPLGAVDIFVPGITNLQGSADAHFTISGTTQDSIVYRGDAVIPRSSFIFEATNLKYFAEGKATLLNRTVTVEQLQLANDPLDYQKGRASAKGTITVNSFDITGFDVTAQIPQQGLFVLGNATRIPQPQLYGDVIIATGEKPLHFYGTLEKPYLRGDVNVLAAKVSFPEIRSVKSENRLFCFETITKDRTGRTITARDCNQQEYTLLMQRDSSQTEEGLPNLAPKQLSAAELAEFSAEQAVLQQYDEHGHETLAIGHLPLVIGQSPSDSTSAPSVAMPNVPMTTTPMTNLLLTNAPLTFAEKIDYALNVKLKGNFSVTMEWGPFEQLVANLAQENPETPLRYIKTPDRPDEHQLFGDLILRDGSTYKYYRIFNASGKVAFNTGVMSNPRLSINAALRGQRTQPDRSGTSEYLVNLGITGTKKSPNLKMSYLLDNAPGVGDSVKIQNDAIMLLLFGRTQDEFAIGSGVGEAITQNSSSLASRLLTDLLQGTGVVRSADIFFAGGRTGSPLELQQARVQFTGEISNLGVLWQIGNDIGTNTPNTSFSIDIPFRSFLDQELFRNIVLQITRSAVTANSSVFMRQQREWEVKLGARNSW